jgi:hypothetical protein
MPFSIPIPSLFASITCLLVECYGCSHLSMLLVIFERDSRGGLLGPWNEEAGFQAYEKLCLGERDCWGIDFTWREYSSSYIALIILDPTCC